MTKRTQMGRDESGQGMVRGLGGGFFIITSNLQFLVPFSLNAEIK